MQFCFIKINVKISALRPYREKSIEDNTFEKPPSECKKSGKGYGISLSDDETAKERFRMRRKILQRKNKICDWSVYIGLTGLFIAIIDVEMDVAFKKSLT
uniref:Uncharacterized protein n=1 Tax=Panagrolaimus sp. PS1159 TaxID=55785 RepID=A0AC35G6X5_9BILA